MNIHINRRTPEKYQLKLIRLKIFEGKDTLNPKEFQDILETIAELEYAKGGSHDAKSYQKNFDALKKQKTRRDIH